MQQRENITVVTSLQETLKVLMTTKPYKGFKDMKTNTVSWRADTYLSRKEQLLFGKKQEIFPVISSMSSTWKGSSAKPLLLTAHTYRVIRKHPEEMITHRPV